MNDTKVAEGTVLGAVAVKSPIEYEQRYECAAWWEKQEMIVGIYPLVLEKNQSYPHHLKVVAKISGKVTDDYFPALYGGVAVSNQPYEAKNVGQERIIRRSWPLESVIRQTGHSPDGKDFDLFLDPRYWHLAQREAEEEIRSMYDHLTSNYLGGDYNRSLSAMGYAGERISLRAKEVLEIRRQVGYLTEKSDIWRNYHHVNTKWARDFLDLPSFTVDDLKGSEG